MKVYLQFHEQPTWHTKTINNHSLHVLYGNLFETKSSVRIYIDNLFSSYYQYNLL